MRDVLAGARVRRDDLQEWTLRPCRQSSSSPSGPARAVHPAAVNFVVVCHHAPSIISRCVSETREHLADRRIVHRVQHPASIPSAAEVPGGTSAGGAGTSPLRQANGLLHLADAHLTGAQQFHNPQPVRVPHGPNDHRNVRHKGGGRGRGLLHTNHGNRPP